MSTTFATRRLERREIYVPHAPLVLGDAAERRIRGTASTADLDHYGTHVQPQGMRAIDGPLPLLFSHDPTRPVGSIEQVERQADAVSFSAKVSDDQVWGWIREGVVAGVSIGFVEHHRSGDRIDDWSLIEISLVTTPANSHARIEEVRSMPQAPAIIEGTAREVVPLQQARVLREISAAAPAVHRRRSTGFSLSSVITAAVRGEQLRGFEAEVCSELAKRSDTETRGIRVPARIFQAPNRREVSTDVGSAAALSPDQWMQELLDDLAAARRWGTLSRRLGYVIVSSTRERVHIPKRETRIQASWGAKDAVATESDTTFDEDTLGPRYANATVTIRRSALRYADPAVDAIVTQDLGSALDDLIDTGLLFGTGAANQPTGLLTGIPAALTINKAGTAIDTPDLMRLKQLMSSTWRLDDTLSGLRWATNPTLVDRLRTTSKKEIPTGGGEWFTGVMPFDSGEGILLGMAMLQSGRIMETAANNQQYNLYLVYGAMAVICYFGGASVDLLIDPYTLSTSGSVRITGFVDVNCIARDPNTAAVIANASVIPPAVP